MRKFGLANNSHELSRRIMTHASLFSGIGGFDLAAEWAGWTNLFHCEWNDFGQRILKHYWPNSESYGNITKTDFRKWRGAVDVVSGGFPCQPYSIAGKRLGKEDDRHLWPEMLRAIREIQPAWVLGENVRGLLNWSGGLVFDEVQADLEAAGYEVIPFLLPACGVNAPHRRDRIWFVAYRRSQQLQERTPQRNLENKAQERAGMDDRIKRQGDTRTTPDTGKIGLSITESIRELGRQQRLAFNYEPKFWERFPTQSPICSGNDGISSQLDGITVPKWRNESIKAAGNAIVPQVAYQIFKAIQQYENTTI